MLSPLFELFVYIAYFTSLLLEMNILKGSPFSSSTRRKLRKSNRCRLGNYKFHQANNSLTDPLLYTFEDTDIELETINSDEESKSNDENSVQTRRSRQSLTTTARNGGSIVTVEKRVLPNETVQAFAIRYRVPVRIFYLPKNVKQFYFSL